VWHIEEEAVVVILAIVAVIELFAGFMIFVTAKSAIHEILGTLMLGFCFLTMALASILAELRRNRTDADGIRLSKN
jgi:hypothetical protein